VTQLPVAQDRFISIHSNCSSDITLCQHVSSLSVRISKHPSGGRGEFELVEDVPGDPRVTDLFGCDLLLSFGAYQIPTGIFLKHQGGKRRLRLRNKGATVHAGLQAAAILMMPSPIREEVKLEGGLPVLRTDGYLLHHIELTNVELLEAAVFQDGDNTKPETKRGLFRATAQDVIYGNQSFQAESLSVLDRVMELESLWEQAGSLPGELDRLLALHRNAVTSGAPVPKGLGKVVQAVQSSFAEYATDLGVIYSRQEDVVPALLSSFGPLGPTATSLIPIDQIPRDEADIRKREIDRWRAVRSRGPSAISFRKNVRKAYDWTCAICGTKFPPTSISKNPGVDSAHILPWATHDVDEVSNGICLCKTHHWAFDEGLLRITYHGGHYFIELGPEVQDAIFETGFSLDDLTRVLGKIPAHRLPSIDSQKPSPDYLRELYEQLD
jgi:putative restriction endonuclease